MEIKDKLLEIWEEECNNEDIEPLIEKLNSLRDEGKILMWLTESDGTLHVCVSEEECYVLSTTSEGFNPHIDEEDITEFLSWAIEMCFSKDIAGFLGYYVAKQDILETLKPLVSNYNAVWEKENAVIRQTSTSEEQDKIGGEIEALMESYGIQSDMSDGNWYFITNNDYQRYCLIFCDDFRLSLDRIS